MKLKQIFAAALLLFSVGTWAQTNLLVGWDGGDDTSSPSNFGWTSSTNRTFNSRNASGGVRMTTTYSGYKLEDGTSYSYSASSDPSSVLFWIRYGSTGESYTYTFKGLEADATYDFSALVGWHNNSNAPTFTIVLNDGSNNLTTMTKYASTKQTLYAINSRFKTPSSMTTETDVKLVFSCNQTGDCMEAISALNLVKVNVVLKDDLEAAIAYATTVNSYLSDTDLTTAIATAQGVYDNAGASQTDVNAATSTLETAVTTAINKAPLTFINPGFESCTVTTANAAATGSAAPLDIAGAWTQTSSAAWSSSAVVEYGGTGQVNGASAPSADNLNNGGYTLGVSVGWGGTVTYKSPTTTWPTGVYTFKINCYNANSGASQFKSLFGFVPTSGSATLSTKTSFTYDTWETDQVTVTLDEPTEGYIQVGGQAVSDGSGSNAKVFFDNITIIYQDPLSGARTIWQEAKATAEAARDNSDYENVTGSERTTLEAEIAKDEPTTAEGYNEAAAALSTATTTFTEAKDAYDTYANFLSNYLPEEELKYATTEKYTAIGDAYFGEGEVVNAADATARIEAAISALRAYYESHAMAEKVEGAVNCADAIVGADPDTNTGWTGGIGTDSRDWEKYTDADGNLSGRYYDGGWSTSAGVNINMSRSIEIPAGKYLLTVTARGSEALTSYTLSVGEDAVDLPMNGSGVDQGVFGHGWDDVSLEFESDGNPVTLTIAAASTDYQQWISFNRFRLMRLELNNDAYAGTTEYDALNSAIETADAYTLGFEDGQYAPYNNVAALEALAAAKAIDQTAELTNLKTDVTAATTALNDATWTANDGDVDAIYNGTFAETGTGSNPKGWSRSNNGWGQQITDLTAETNGVADGTTTAWYYNNNGAWQYGNEGVYIMPLAGNQPYKLSFKYSKHGNDWQNWMKASVVNGSDEGLEVIQFAAAENGTDFVTAEAYFTTGAAGNYILSIEQNGNAHLTDVSLVKAAFAALALNEGITFEPINRTYIETVTLTRKVVAGYNTVCLPFDLTAEQVAYAFGENAKVYTYSETSDDADNVTINFNEKDGNTISANVPVLIGDATASTDTETKTFNAVMFKSYTGDYPVVTGNNVDFVGTYAPIAAIAEGDYFIGNGAIYKSAGNTSMKAFRAYLKVKRSTAQPSRTVLSTTSLASV